MGKTRDLKKIRNTKGTFHAKDSESEFAQSCPTLCSPMDCSPARLLCPWDSPGKNTGGVAISFSRGIFPTQGSNPGLPHCRQML